MLNPNNPNTFTSNAMESGVAVCNPDIADANLENIKYELDNPITILKKPWSANYGYKTSNYADLIASVSTTAVSFKVDTGSTYAPLLITFPNYHTYCITSIANLTGLTAGTSYNYIILESNLTSNGGTATIGGITYPTYNATVTAVDATTYDISAQYGFPSSFGSGSYSLDISSSPYNPVKYTTSWETVQFLKIGEGTPASPITYAYNRRYISADTACVTATNTATTFTHNLGTQLYKTTLYLRNITAEYGYTAGQVIPAIVALTDSTPYFVVPYIGVNNKNSVVFRSGLRTAYKYLGQNQSTGEAVGLTSANWKQFCIVEGIF